jgi:thiol-disulfide isomerase/thioredoxin
MIFKATSKAVVTITLVLTYSASLALEEGDLIPEFDIASIYEDQPNISLKNLEGKTLFIDFWASWCAPCITSLPLYNEIYHKYQDQGLEVIAVNVDNPIEDGLDFLLDTPLDFLIPQDPEGDVSEMFGVIGMPSSYLVSPDGNVRLVHMGFRNGDIDSIEEEIQKVLAEN